MELHTLFLQTIYTYFAQKLQSSKLFSFSISSLIQKNVFLTFSYCDQRRYNSLSQKLFAIILGKYPTEKSPVMEDEVPHYLKESIEIRQPSAYL